MKSRIVKEEKFPPKNMCQFFAQNSKPVLKPQTKKNVILSERWSWFIRWFCQKNQTKIMKILWLEAVLLIDLVSASFRLTILHTNDIHSRLEWLNSQKNQNSMHFQVYKRSKILYSIGIWPARFSRLTRRCSWLAGRRRAQKLHTFF